MLVLSRKLGEKIQIGRDVILTVVRIQGDKVRLAIQAPREVGVWRTEIAPIDGEGEPAGVST